MPHRVVTINSIGDVTFYKRRNNKSVRIKICGSDIRVSIPFWMTYNAARSYVKTKQHWILQHLHQKPQYQAGTLIGKQHKVVIQQTIKTRITTKITHNHIIARIPSRFDVNSDTVQNKIDTAVKRALRIQAEDLLIPRVRQIAQRHNFIVHSVAVKNLRSRWGSCSNNHELVFSLYLIQLPWHLIDYVVYHELAHTRHMNHSKQFWQLVASCLPDYQMRRQKLKNYSPHVRISPSCV